MGTKKIKICHKRGGCIGCGSCAQIAPEFWKMNQEDGLSDLKNAKDKGKDFLVAEVDEEDYEQNKKAADACPVSVIRVSK